MSATKFGIVVSTANAIVSRLIYPIKDEELLTVPLKQGEMLIQVNNDPLVSADAWKASIDSAVQQALGKSPGNPRCCVIDKLGNVVNVFMGDSTLDAPAFPNMTLVNSNTGDVGWTWTAKDGFTAPPVIPTKITHTK